MNRKYFARETKKVLVYVIALILCLPALSTSALAVTDPPDVSALENEISDGGGTLSQNLDDDSNEAGDDQSSDNGSEKSGSGNSSSQSEGNGTASSGQTGQTPSGSDKTTDDAGETPDITTGDGIESPDTQPGAEVPDNATGDSIESPDNATGDSIESPENTTGSGIEPPAVTTGGSIETTSDGALEILEETTESAITVGALRTIERTPVTFKLSQSDDEYSPFGGNTVEFEILVSTGGAVYSILLNQETTVSAVFPDGVYTVEPGSLAPVGYNIASPIGPVTEFLVSSGAVYAIDHSLISDPIEIFYTQNNKRYFAIELSCEFSIGKNDNSPRGRGFEGGDLDDAEETGLVDEAEDDSLSGIVEDESGTPEEQAGSESGSPSTDSAIEMPESVTDTEKPTVVGSTGTVDGDLPIPVVDDNESKEPDNTPEDQGNPPADDAAGEGSLSPAQMIEPPPTVGSTVRPMEDLYKDLISNDMYR